MDGKESLRQYQTRLAALLADSQTGSQQRPWLACRAAGRGYLFDLACLGEIVPLRELQAVPYCKNWFLGVISSRGSLLSVVDFGLWMASLSDANHEKPQTDFHAAPGPVLALAASMQLHVALQLEAVHGLRGPADFLAPPSGTEVSELSATKTTSAIQSTIFVDAQDQSWHWVDLRQLGQSPDFLQVAIQNY